MKTDYVLFRGPVSRDRFDVMETRDGESVGVSKSFVSEELARICDEIERMNHMEETHYEGKDCKALSQ